MSPSSSSTSRSDRPPGGEADPFRVGAGDIERQSLIRALPATVDAVPTARQAVVEFAEALGASADAQWAVRLAVSEAVTNVVRHAYVGREVGAVRIEAHPEDGVLIVLVCDDGIGPAPRSDSPGSGFGLGLVAACTIGHELDCVEGGRGSRMAMRFALAG